MNYFIALTIGFLLGALAGLKLAEVLLADLQRRLKLLERRLMSAPPVDPLETSV